MKIGLGLYRHMLTRDYYDFARQAGCTHVMAHLVDYFNQATSNPRNNQPTGSKYDPWGVAGDPNQLWTTRGLTTLRAQIEDAGLFLAARTSIPRTGTTFCSTVRNVHNRSKTSKP